MNQVVSDSQVIAEKELICDVLVVGMGIAGLVAALRALELGAKVISIDKQSRGWWTPGGDMIVSGGVFHLSSCRMNAPEAELIEKILAATEGMIPPDLLNVTVGNSGRALKWLVENGAEFLETSGKERRLKPSFPQPVWGRVKPGGIQDAVNFGNKRLALNLESRIKEKGGSILYETKAIKLLTNAMGRVTGLTAQDKKGRFNIKARAVILCTGGYLRNKEMLLKYLGPCADEIIVYSGPGCTGDAFKMCEELGAYLRSMNHAGFTHLYSADAYYKEDLVGAHLEVVARQGIIINREGERFVDESLGPRIVGSLMTKTTIYQKGWIILDNAIYSSSEGIKKKVADVREFGGTIHTADTIEELARRAGISPRLQLTITEFNRAVDEGETELLRSPRKEHINKISTPPFYAIPFVPGIVSTYGGFLVSPKAEILDWDKKPIPGLYAAGLTMQGSLSGGVENSDGAYVGCLGACLIFGILSAENAVTIQTD
ncbi:FAD-dependent oxidoreductase [Chloroflexota bacterium]